MKELLGRNASRPLAAKHRAAESRRHQAHHQDAAGNGLTRRGAAAACCRENLRAPGEKRETMWPKAAMPECETEASTTR